MQRALTLARATTALASPNPQVGCVLTRLTSSGPEIIGEGAHLYANRDHAEIVALKQAHARNLSPAEATAYVTLEPCAHHGRTPPCADALIAARVARVVVATEDPNPLVAGSGLARLRSAGIEVSVGLLQQPARELNNPFACFITERRPFVTLKAALSADGYLAPPPSQRSQTAPVWLTGPAARHEVQLLRHSSDAILTGIGTVLADDPALTDRSGLPRRRPLLRVVLDTHLRLPRGSQLVRLSQNDVLVFCGTDAPTARVAALESDGVEVVMLPQHSGRLGLASVLDALAERSILSLLLETGSRLNAAFLTQRLVDRVLLFRSPRTLGSHSVSFAANYISPEQIERDLLNPQRSAIDDDTLVEGLLRNPWPVAPSLAVPSDPPLR